MHKFLSRNAILVQPLTVVRATTNIGGARVLAAPPLEEEEGKTGFDAFHHELILLQRELDEFLKATNRKVATEEEALKSMMAPLEEETEEGEEAESSSPVPPVQKKAQPVSRGSQLFRPVQKKKAVTGDDVEMVEVRKLVEKRNIPNILNLEDGEFPEESGWFLLGRKVEVAISTARGVNRLVDQLAVACLLLQIDVLVSLWRPISCY